MNAKWLLLHHLSLIEDYEQECQEKEKLKVLAKEADVIFYYFSNKVFFFLVAEIIPNLRREVDIVCFMENLGLSPSERNSIYSDQINQLGTLTELRKQRKIGRVICINPTAEYLAWKSEPKAKEVDFFPAFPCEIAAYKLQPLDLTEKKEFFVTYHRWGNPAVLQLVKSLPGIVVENSGRFPPLTFCEIINLSFCYIHSSPVGGLRSFNAALTLNTPIIIYLSHHPYVSTIELTKESYIAQALNLKHSPSWMNSFPVILDINQLHQLLNKLINSSTSETAETLEKILDTQSRWKKTHEEITNVYLIWQRWLDTFGYPLPAELSPITLILPTYLGDEPEVYKGLYPEGPWQKADFSLNYPNLQTQLRQRNNVRKRRKKA